MDLTYQISPYGVVVIIDHAPSLFGLASFPNMLVESFIYLSKYYKKVSFGKWITLSV